MKRILIDGRFVGVGESVSRYTLEIVRGILALDKENEYTLLIRPMGINTVGKFFAKSEIRNPKSETNSNDQFLKYFGKPGFENSKLVSNLDIRYSNLKVHVFDIPHYSGAEQTKLLQYLNKEKFDLVHFTQFNHPVLYRGKFVVTIHDLTMLGYLHRTNPLKKYAFSRTMRHAVKRSAKILTVSNTSKREIIDYYHVPAAKIAVIYNGIDHEKYNIQVKSEKACPEPASGGVEGLKVKSFKEKYHIDGDYLLYAGLWKKHKNLKRLLEAFEKLKVENEKLKDLRLVITGKKDRDEPEIIEEINRVNNALNSKFLILNSVITTGFLDEAELPIAYTGALAYVIPSLSEGFGMPPVEALACGTPVIASNVSCMPEILGDAALYFDPYDLEDMAKAMERITTDEKLRDEIISKGLEQVKKYNWSNTAKETLDVYRELI